MTLTIGIDFDNTIANYDQVFQFVAKDKQFVNSEWKGNKKQLRDYLKNTENGELKWQELQGLVYGKFMHRAEIFPGLVEFLTICKYRKISIFVVSHKTEFGHFDNDKINLRIEALNWLENKFHISSGSLGILKENVFFYSTRFEKIQKIAELNCDYFIDDLIEVFEEESFPKKVNKVLFDRNFESNLIHTAWSTLRSWSKIKTHLLGETKDTEVESVLFEFLNFKDVQNLKILKGNGNSKIFSFSSFGEKLLIKIYPDLGIDSRPRLRNEFKVLSKLYHSNFPVPKPILESENLNWGIFQFIEGSIAQKITGAEISKALNFCRDLISFQKNYTSEDFNLASEACFSGEEIVTQIQNRFNILKKLDDSNLNDFLTKGFLPKFDEIVQYFRSNCMSFPIPIDQNFWVLSPSDFGIHNALKTEFGEYYFIDFEYFGWDDPAKLISDFYWHPAMNLDNTSKSIWVNQMLEIYFEDAGLSQRLKYFLPLIGFRWCLILLNEFRSDKLSNRIHANQHKIEKIEEIKALQLQRSIELFHSVISLHTEDLFKEGCPIG